MDFDVNCEYGGFALKDRWEIKELESIAHLFEHSKTGARLLYLKNTDDNKVFCISFRTPTSDSCGTPHIMEHSVLCGSDKYPLKEPFVELVKSSLSTFLNAMTYPDKTMYPVASKNNADLRNLMDVYLDAVFNPLIAHNKLTFLQEGWHYRLENKNDPITINGVVYNEMKGAYSAPSDLLQNFAMSSLYPDTQYRHDSGGNPDEIPGLSYEEFIDFYKKYYHPSNSYIYLYGDMDPTSYMEHIDEYLSKYDKIDLDSLPATQDDFTAAVTLHEVYSVSEDEESPRDKNYFSANYRIGTANDTLLSYAFNVLGAVLLDSDSSPLKKALIDAQIADEILFEYTTCLIQPYFSIVAKNAKEDKFDIFASTIEKTLEKLYKEGIDDSIITSALNSYEFELREADSGNYPKGLLYLIDIMESWLYDERPGIHLEYEKNLKILRENENSRFYRDLIKKYLIDNPNKSLVKLSPQKGLASKKAEALKNKLSAYKASLSDEEIDRLIMTTRELIKNQETADTEEARNTVPVLELSEIDANLPKPDFDIMQYKKARIFTHADKARGIVYADINFPLKVSNEREVCAASLLTKLIGVYATKKYSELELSNLIGTYLGDMDASVSIYQNIKDIDVCEVKFTLSAKALASNADKLFEISTEVLENTLVGDMNRLGQTVSEEISKFNTRLLSSAHSVVSERLTSYELVSGAYKDLACGFAYYSFLKDIKNAIDENDASVLDELTRLLARLVTSSADILITYDEANKDAVVLKCKEFIDQLKDEKTLSHDLLLKPLGKRNEAILTPAHVNYVGIGANFKALGFEYSPKLLAAKKYLASGYLWDKIRLVGGAYGCFMIVDKAGRIQFISYRDPNLAETLSAYNGIAGALKNAEITQTDLNKIIIGTISDIDAPKPVYAIGRQLLSDYYREETREDYNRDRAEILSCKIEDITAVGELIQKSVENSSVCVVGEESSVEDNSSSFDRILSQSGDYK